MINLLPASEIMLQRISKGKFVIVTKISDSIQQLIDYDFVILEKKRNNLELKPTASGIFYLFNKNNLSTDVN